jgi:hypothetical protein
MPLNPGFSTPVLPDSEVQAGILSEFSLSGDSTANSLMPMWWGFAPNVDSYGQTNQFLQYLYTKKRVIAYLIAQQRMMFDTTLGTDKFSASQIVKNLLSLMKATTDEIQYADPGANTPWLESAEPLNKSAGAAHIRDFFSREFYTYWDWEWQVCYFNSFGSYPYGSLGMGLGGYYGVW